MQVHKRNYHIAVLLLFLGAVCVLRIDSARGLSLPAKQLAEFPHKIGQWQGKDIAVDESAYEILATRNVLLREYIDPAQDRIGLAVVYSGNNRTSFHPPEICYLGGGVELADKTTERFVLAGGEALTTNKLLMRDASGELAAWYWFASQGAFTHSYCKQQLRILANGLRYNRRDGALIRVSARLAPHNRKNLEAKVAEFIRAVTPLIRSALEKKLDS